ncbi:SCO6880 family protein [Changpingibacter yushuensis]|uniref:SCO6880 family protein n=1 Tax=Changpingibacter yushuensis TaxID=2758440 RepID=UPI0021CD9CC7|nr:SCO6880 family protein [Changpingibacter yushuensis]
MWVWTILLDQLTWSLQGIVLDRHEAEQVAARAFRHNMWDISLEPEVASKMAVLLDQVKQIQKAGGGLYAIESRCVALLDMHIPSLRAHPPRLRHPTILLPTVHTHALRPSRPRHPQEETEYISDAAQRQKIGQIEDASQTAEYHDVLQQEAELTAGHGILCYTGLISVSATATDDLDIAIAAIEQAAIQASCETRLLVGQQAQAFTATALPHCAGSYR